MDVTFQNTSLPKTSAITEPDAGEKTAAHSGEQTGSANFLNRKIERVSDSSSWKSIIGNAYTTGNRSAVAFGLAGGAAGAAFYGPSGATWGMTAGSSFGGHFGFVAGGIQKFASPSSGDAVAEISEADVDQPHEADEKNPFLNRVVEVVDHAGHQAALVSLGVGVAALLLSLATGNPVGVAIHGAGVYSGAAWAFGLTTGSAQWLRRHVNHVQSQVQSAAQAAHDLGDVELAPIESTKIEGLD